MQNPLFFAELPRSINKKSCLTGYGIIASEKAFAEKTITDWWPPLVSTNCLGVTSVSEGGNQLNAFAADCNYLTLQSNL